jgi:hypothetical protein
MPQASVKAILKIKIQARILVQTGKWWGLFLIISILEITTKQVITPFVKKNLDFWK